VVTTGSFIIPHIDSVRLTPTTTRTITTSSWTNFPDTSSLTFTKHSNDTKVIATVCASGYVTAVAATASNWGLSVGSTTYEVAYFFFNVTDDHAATSGMKQITDLPAGAYTSQLRWRRVDGTGTVATDGNNRISFSVEETY